jgi:hypothetical protein
VAHGLKFAGSFSGASFFQGDFSTQLQATGVDATAYAALLPGGKIAVIILNKDADKDIEITLNFGKGRGTKVEAEAMHSSSLESREAHITPSPKPAQLKDGKHTTTIPHASGYRLTLS